MDHSIKIGGEAGQGIQTIGDVLGKVFSRAGYHVFTNQDYESRIRGGHNFYQIRLSSEPVMSPRRGLDILVALDNESIVSHESEVLDNGVIIYDSGLLKKSYEGPKFFDIPFVQLATDTGAGKIVGNTVATGAILGMLGFTLEILFDILKEILKKKDDRTQEQNRQAARMGYEFAQKYCTRCAFSLKPAGKPKMLVGGNEALAFGAVAGGCTFYSAYPMTPSTGIMVFLGLKAAEYGIIMEQAEDEIAAINMAIGASFAGVRSMTGTSGGGFALMVEGLSLAAMTETPVVVALAQRPAPATGLPTRTEQGDLLFALNAGHGEFPRVVFAPGNPEQAIYLTAKAFDIAQKYQIPAIVMTDQYLADSQWTYDDIPLGGIIMHTYRASSEELEKLDDYKRHAFTPTGVSPFGIPGRTRHVVVTDSDEHTEAGHITEDVELRKKMVEKRLFLKIDSIRSEIAPPAYIGGPDPEVVLVSWGSTYGIIREAMQEMSDRNVAMLHFSEIYPFPSREKFDYVGILEKTRKTICIENNATGQFARLLASETGYRVTDNILWYDGRPLLLEGLVEELRGRI